MKTKQKKQVVQNDNESLVTIKVYESTRRQLQALSEKQDRSQIRVLKRLVDSAAASQTT